MDVKNGRNNAKSGSPQTHSGAPQTNAGAPPDPGPPYENSWARPWRDVTSVKEEKKVG